MGEEDTPDGVARREAHVPTIPPRRTPLRPPQPMSDNIMNAPHGMNLVVECSDGSAVIGRFDESNGFEVVMHDVDLWESDQGSAEERENWVRSTATYGVAVKERDHRFSARLVERWRPLGDIEKLS